MDNETNTLRDRVAQIIGSLPTRIVDTLTPDEMLNLKLVVTLTLRDHADDATRAAFRGGARGHREAHGSDVVTAESALRAMADNYRRDQDHDATRADLRRLFDDPELGPPLRALLDALLAEAEVEGGIYDHERDGRISTRSPEAP